MKKVTICIAALLLTSCTVISTPDFKVYDFHPSGDAIDVSVTKADGTSISAVRQQGSSAEVITAAAALVPTTP